MNDNDCISRSALYEKTAEWEAQAFHMVEKHMNDVDTTEWRKWVAILAERSAFKFDVAGAPTVPHEMSAVEYFKEKARMKATLLEECKKRAQCREPSCRRCQWSYRDRVPNGNFEREFPNESIAIVEKWAWEHPEE